MRTLLVSTAVCLTAGTFVAAERLTSSTEQTRALEQQAATQAALDQFERQSSAAFAGEIADLEKARASAQAQIALLTSTVEDITTNRDELAAQVATTQEATDAMRGTLAELEATNSDLVARLEVKEASLLSKDAELDALNAQMAALAEDAGGASGLEAENAQLVEEVASLNALLQTRDATIGTLQDRINADPTALDGVSGEGVQVENAAAAEELQAAVATIDELTAQAAQSEKTIQAINTDLRARDTTIAQLQAELALHAVAADASGPAEETTTAPSENLAVLEERLAALTELVDTQTKTISNLRMGFEEEPASAMEMASACIERASKIFEISQIKFATGTSSISEQSVTTLDHLRDLAIGCESDELIIEIGGHTDSLGSEANNQSLSEARAQSVREFLIGRGIAAEKMIAVGYGEAQPIASNDTQVGRAQNRRITFTWQMRDAQDAPAETADSVDG